MEKLYNKYRFKSFEEVAGMLPHVQKLEKDIETNRIDHTYLFYGGHGVGKTSMARMIASKISDCYIEEVSSAIETGVDKSREIAKKATTIPLGYKNKLIILDEVQRGSVNFFDALLKITEETGDNTYFILCTTEIKKIPANIRSRFTDILFEAPTLKAMREHLSYICEQEGIEASRKVLTKICNKNECVPRDCISDLEKIIGISKEDTQLSLVGESFLSEESVGFKIAQALGQGNWKTTSSLLLPVVESEIEGIRRLILNYYTKKLLNTTDKNGAQTASLILDSFKNPFFDSGKGGFVLACYENCE
jgi:DNA polymerase III gamma/tau subunit